MLLHFIMMQQNCSTFTIQLFFPQTDSFKEPPFYDRYLPQP